MAGVMAQCGGLQCMLNRLAGVKDFKQGRHLLTVSCGQYDCQALCEAVVVEPLDTRGQCGTAETSASAGFPQILDI